MLSFLPGAIDTAVIMCAREPHLFWLESGVFEYVISGLVVLALAGPAITIAHAWRRTR